MAPSAVDAVVLHGFAALSDRVRGFVDRDAALLAPMQSALALHAEQLARLHDTAQLAEDLRDALVGLMDDASVLARAAEAVARQFSGERERNADFQCQMLEYVATMRAEIAELRRARPGP